MVSVDYRLSSQAVFPAQLHDVRAAIRWVRRNAAEIGVDPERIAAWGSSAGAHLAALAGTASPIVQLPGEPDPEGTSSAVRAVVVGCGPTDVLQIRNCGPELNPDTFEARLIGAAPGERPDLAAAANPITYAGREAPPFLIMHGLADEAVPEVDLYLIDGYAHGFFNAPDRPDFHGPAFLDNGALQPRPGAFAVVRRHRRGGADVVDNTHVSYDAVRDFLTTHLMSSLTSRSAHVR